MNILEASITLITLVDQLIVPNLMILQLIV